MNLLRTLSTVSALTLLSRITGLAARKPQGRRVRRRTADGRVRGGVPPAEHPAPAVRRGRVLAGVRADPRRVPALARRRRDARPGRDASARCWRSTLLVVSVLGIVAAPWLVYVLAGGFAQHARQGRADRGADPHHVSVHPVRVAGLARRRRAERLSALRDSRVHAGAAQPRRSSAAAVSVAPYVDPPIVALAWGVFDRRRRAARAFRSAPLAQARHAAALALDWRDEGVRRVLRAMGPAVLGVSAAQISALDQHPARRAISATAAFRGSPTPTA